MKKLLQLTLVTILFFAINSCKKNETNLRPDPIVPFENAKTITTVVAGQVTAQDGTPLNNVEITIGAAITVTDADGNFIIPNATLSEKAGFIKATKANYFAGSRTIVAKENVVNNVVIQLIKKTASGDFSNAAGGTITVATGGSIIFPTNAVVTKTGAAYSGTVKVSAYFLDPTSDNCYKEMPGDLRGINASNNEQVLTSYGMMAVELNGSNGEVLQLATGKSATLNFPIAAATQSAAPATIPLWFFDETKGMWIEQGTATKTGNTYVGSVSHFTWWNCDWGGGPLTYTATFVDEHGSPLSNYRVYYITSSGWGGGGGSGFTASDGSATGNIPANTPIIIKVVAYCGNTPTTIYTATVGPFTQNTNGGTITVTLPTISTTTSIKGTVVNCSNNPIIKGYAIIKFNNKTYYTNIANGLFNKTIVNCSTAPTGTATITVFDLTTLKKNTTPATIIITGAGTFNIGQVAACGVQAFVHYTATFVNQNGANLSQYYVRFGDSISLFPQTALIDVIIPANKTMTRKVYANTTCGGYILADSTQIGPFTTDFNAGTINVNVPQANTLTISGTVNTCSNTAVTNGIATIVVDGNTYTAIINNGSFSLPLTRCNTNTVTATINVLDNVNNQQNSTPITASVSNNNVNIGTVQACGININPVTTDTLYYTLDGKTYMADSSSAYLQNLTTIAGQFYSTYPNANFSGTFSGTSGLRPFSISLKDSSAITYITSNNISNASVTVNVIEYGAVGKSIRGSFSGNVVATGTTLTKPITGYFRIKRTQ